MQFTKKGVTVLALLVNFTSLQAQQKLNIISTEAIPVIGSNVYQSPGNYLIQYTGRIEMKNNSLPRFWSPGVYIVAKFHGDLCEFFLNDEVLDGNSHNYIEIVIDKKQPSRLQLKWKNNKIKIQGLNKNDHVITICKNTEAGIGHLEFAGFNCNKLLPLPGKPLRKIEFIGNSITCGAGMDLSVMPCNQGTWYDQHNAWMSYGALTARTLQAQWHLSSVSGIGLIHSCCSMAITMPEVFDKINMRADTILWNFKSYIPGVVTICLGQNDGIQDSATFCEAYIHFIEAVQKHYAAADIILLTSPMGDATLTAVLKNYLQSIEASYNKKAGKKIHTYFFTKRYSHGCGGHPDFEEHREIAGELTAYIKKLENW